ncbi:Periplasmic serine proteases (ClpP class) [hydrothermal vent metagenome]|uniref:Periplasmic serine proteases (ClpP class) n=1 Tax=hydrothermal vent metagenome TaxID=652676 RepID=A0A3B1AFR7_9ZZZZ
MTDQQTGSEQKDPKWEEKILTKLLFSTLEEQKKTRRWSIVFKSFIAGYLLLVLFGMFVSSATKDALPGGEHTALIEVKGVISADSEASADNIVTGLRRAFKNDDAKAVILRINSPGGSPVQAGYVNDEIKRLREKYPDKKLYAVITDLCASGGYYIAAAADEIYADKASMVGSIGVVMNSFGFVDTMKKLGVERRLYTAGENKGFLDPFSPQKADETQHVQTLLKQIHQQFINTVKDGRGDKLKDEKKLFSGLIWTGEQAIELGLVDKMGSSSMVARDVVKAEKLVNYTLKPSYFEQLAERFGVAFAGKMFETMTNSSFSLN